MSEKFMGVYLDEEEINKFHLLALKEKKKLKQLHKEIISDYIKKHQDGMMQYNTLASYGHLNFDSGNYAQIFVKNCLKYSRS